MIWCSHLMYPTLLASGNGMTCMFAYCLQIVNSDPAFQPHHNQIFMLVPKCFASEIIPQQSPCERLQTRQQCLETEPIMTYRTIVHVPGRPAEGHAND